VTAKQRLLIYTSDYQPIPRPGMMLIGLVPPVEGTSGAVDGTGEQAAQKQTINRQ
jgi:hypothetical protein